MWCQAICCTYQVVFYCLYQLRNEWTILSICGRRYHAPIPVDVIVNTLQYSWFRNGRATILHLRATCRI